MNKPTLWIKAFGCCLIAAAVIAIMVSIECLIQNLAGTHQVISLILAILYVCAIGATIWAWYHSDDPGMEL